VKTNGIKITSRVIQKNSVVVNIKTTEEIISAAKFSTAKYENP
jgi:hypothetical protein